MTASPPRAPRRPIRRLSAETVEKIAAGEVVERPASVVKELVENAIDAGASEVRVELGGGGLALLRVDDNGLGIPPAELPLAVERHATSKLQSAEEIAEVATLGFRGEALASIGAVSRLSLTSRPPNQDEARTIRVVGGTVEPGGVAGRPPGTSVEVHDLFFNTPARRKFLKSPAAEQVEVTALLERMYLARPEVGLVVVAEGRELGRYPAARTLRDACGRVFGAEFLGQSFEVAASLPAGGRLAALLGRPVLSRSTSQGLHISVNGRAIVSRALAQAVRAAFLDYLPRTRFPVGAVALTVDPRRLDVNVHPTKREVRFADEREVTEAVRRGVREALLGVRHAAEPARLAAGRGAAVVAPSARPALLEGLRPPAAPRTRQRALVEAGPPPEVAAGPRHPGLKLLGCLFALYWVAEGDGTLVLVDQHAASERVLFDTFRREGRLGRQELLHPVIVSLVPRARSALEAHAEEVAGAGFDVQPFGGDRFRVSSVPSFLGRRLSPDSLLPLLDELADGGRPTVPDGLVDRVAASIACHAAVRAGDAIEAAKMQRILARLYALPEASYACPHGRPILVELPRGRLDRLFLRAGP